MKKSIAILAMLVGSTAAFAQAEQKPSYSVTVDFPFVTKYVFRGATFSDKAVLQPSVKITQDNAYAGIWFNLPVAGFGTQSNEVDFYAGYMLPVSDTIKADFGATVYMYPDDGGADGTTAEIYAGLNFTAGGFTPSIYAYYDFQNETFVAQGSVGYSLPLADLGTSLDLTAILGYAIDEGVYYPDTYAYYSIGAAVPYKLAENTKVTLGFSWNGNNASFMDDAEFVGSLSVTSGF